MPFKYACWALALANLTFYDIFDLLNDPSDLVFFELRYLPTRVDYVALLLNVLLLALLLWSIGLWGRNQNRWVKKFLTVGFIAGLGLAGLNPLLKADWAAKHIFPVLTPLEHLLLGHGWLGYGLALAMGAAVVTPLIIFDRRFRSWGQTLCWLLLPFVAVTFFQMFTRMSQVTQAPALSTPALMPAKQPAHRVFFLLFDHFDYEHTFTHRHPTVKLPQLDRLHQESFFATHAHSPHVSTPQTIPALMLGQRIQAIEDDFSNMPYLSANDMQVYIEGQNHPTSLQHEPNLFGKVRALGYHTAVTGWAGIPYCRTYSADIDQCDWESDFPYYEPARRSVFNLMAAHAGNVLLTNVFLFPFDWHAHEHRKQHTRRYLALREASFRNMLNPDIDFFYGHFPIPHSPYIYNRFRNELALDADPAAGIWDNTVLTDRFIGELRQTLEEAGIWDKAFIILTGDHGRIFNGVKSNHVPFIVKFPGTAVPLGFNDTFDTVLGHDLVLALLKDEIHTPQDLAAWIQQKQAHLPTPTPKIFPYPYPY